TAVGLTEKSRPMVGRATLTMVVSMMDMNMAATKTTLTATFSLTRAVMRGLADCGGAATSGCAFMMSFLERSEQASGPTCPAAALVNDHSHAVSRHCRERSSVSPANPTG